MVEGGTDAREEDGDALRGLLARRILDFLDDPAANDDGIGDDGARVARGGRVARQDASLDPGERLGETALARDARGPLERVDGTPQLRRRHAVLAAGALALS